VLLLPSNTTITTAIERRLYHPPLSQQGDSEFRKCRVNIISTIEIARKKTDQVLQISNQLLFFTKIQDFHMPNVKNLGLM